MFLHEKIKKVKFIKNLPNLAKLVYLFVLFVLVIILFLLLRGGGGGGVWSLFVWLLDLNYLCNQYLSPVSCETEPHSWRGVLDTTLCD